MLEAGNKACGYGFNAPLQAGSKALGGGVMV